MQTQGAIGNLINRYRAVLKKCRLLNVFGSLAVAGLLVMGGAGVAGAAAPDWAVETDVTIGTISGITSAAVNTYVASDPNTSVQNLYITDGGTLDLVFGLTNTGSNTASGNPGMTVTMDGGTINIDSDGSNYAGIQGKTFTITGGEINVTGDNTTPADTGRASIGGWEGFIMDGDARINLASGGAIYGGGETGTQLNSGTITMGQNTHIQFSKNGTAKIGPDMDITVTGTDAQFKIGNTSVENTGKITVNAGAELTLTEMGTVSGTYDGGFTHAGGTMDVAGKVMLKEDTALNVTGGTVKVTGAGRILGNSHTLNDGTFTMSDGTLIIDASENQTLTATSIDVTSAKISGGTVEITGNDNSNSAYIGGYDGLEMTGGNVTLNKNSVLFGGSTYGTNISGGTITMNEGSNLWFSDSGTNTLGEGATIKVEGNAYIGTGANLESSGNINVAADKTLIVAAETHSGTPGTKTSNLSQTGGTISTAGTIDLKRTDLTVGDGATLKTEGAGYVNTDANSDVTVAAGGTLNASAASVNNGGAIRGSGNVTLTGANVIITNGNVNTNPEDVVQAGSDNIAAAASITDDTGLITYASDGAGGFRSSVRSATSILPNLDGELGDLVAGMIRANLRDTSDAAPAGVRFLSRAISPLWGGSVENRTATIESAARTAAIAGVPQMTYAAQKAANAAVTQRTSLAAPASAGLQAVAADGSVQTGASAGDAMKNGFAMWIMPLYQSWNAWGMEGGNLDMDVNGSLGGLAVGADYTFAHAFRAGITVNMGGGYAEGSGDFNKTTNNFTFWGLGAYLGWSKDNFGLTADINHTWVYNDVEQDLAATMRMDTLKSDITSRALSAGLRGEYKLATDALDITPHVGVRYTYLTTDSYDVESGNANVLEGDAIHQGIWTFPIGVAFSKDVQMDSGWYVKPSLDVAVIPAAGDIKARGDVRFTGVAGSAEVSTQTMDYITYMGQAGLEFGNDNVKLGVNYNLQMGAQSTAHGVFGTLRYEF